MRMGKFCAGSRGHSREEAMVERGGTRMRWRMD